MMYYAHPNELLESHLELTGLLAEKYGNEFQSGNIAKLNGIFHDAPGKRCERFQNVLIGTEHKIDHAITAAELFPYFCKFMGYKFPSNKIATISQHIMAGHHSRFGLTAQKWAGCITDCHNSKNIYGHLVKAYPLKNHLDFPDEPTKDNGKRDALKSIQEFEEIMEWLTTEELFKNLNPSKDKGVDITTNVGSMLYARMLFSCLVDADYTATSMYQLNQSAKEKALLDSENTLDVDKAYKNFINYYEKNYLPSETQINQLRAKVYADAANTDTKVGMYKMSAPTGMGKTMALMRFALEHAKANGQKRIIVVLPFLSIIEQNTEKYREIFDGCERVVYEADSAVEYSEDTRELIERWNAPIIITTAVNFFQTLFSSRPVVLRKLHRIANSVIVFDEAQTLPFELTTITYKTLEELKNYNTSVLLSTATQPVLEFRQDCCPCAKEVITDVDKLFKDYDIAKNTRVEFDTKNNYTYQSLAEKFKYDTQVLFVVNTIKKARELFEEVCRQKGEDNTFLLTSHFRSDHKKDIIEEIVKRQKNNEPCFLISTQCIEAGVDFDFPKGCREYAPLTSIIQTAGRIGRNGERESYMLVFDFKDSAAPNCDYRNQGEYTRTLAKQNEHMSIYNPAFTEKYFDIIFRQTKFGKDSEEIHTAEKEMNLIAMDDSYKIIEQKSGLRVIVPYEYDKNKEKYDALIKKIRKNNYMVSRDDLKKANAFSANVIGRKQSDFIRTHCHQLSMYNDTPIEWFVADNQNIYTTKGGLHFE